MDKPRNTFELHVYVTDEAAQRIRRAASISGDGVSTWARRILIARAEEILTGAARQAAA